MTDRLRTGAVAGILGGILLFGVGVLVGQQAAASRKTLVHAFSFRAVPGTTQAQLDDLWAATRKMAAATPAIRGIWMGRVTRHSSDQYGIVLEFDNEAAHKVYDQHPAHDEWVKTYSKIRAEPTNTFDLQGQ